MATRLHLDNIIFKIQKQGGISNYWLNLINYFIRTGSFSIGYTNFIDNKFVENIPHINTKKKYIYKGIISRLAPVSTDKTDIFHSSYYRTPLTKVSRNVVTVHDFMNEIYARGIKKNIHSLMKTHAIRKSTHIICISNSTKRDLERFCPDLVKKKICIIPHGVDHNNFFLTDEEKTNEIIFVGQRGGYKRFDIAQKALKIHKDLILNIVGPPLTAKEKKELDFNLKSRWKYSGYLSLKSLRKLYNRSFALIYPSDYEGFGMPILEAFASGCPVIASNKSSIPEVAGESALMAERQDYKIYEALIKELKTNNSYKRFVQSGLLRAKLFSWDRTFDLTEKFYKE